MPKVKNWQDWDNEEETPRSRKRKSGGREPYSEDSPLPTDRKRVKTERRRQVEDSPIGETMPDLSSMFTPPAPVATPQPARAAMPPPPREAKPYVPPKPLAQAPHAVGGLTPGQEVRMAYRRGGPREIYNLIKGGTPVARIAVALGMAPEMVQDVYRHQQDIERATAPAGRAVRLFERGVQFGEIAGQLGVSEAEARALYARGHVQRYGVSPVKQYKEGKPFPAGVFQQPTYMSEGNRASPAISQILAGIRAEMQSRGFTLKTVFEPDAMGGRHTVSVHDAKGDRVGEPFRLSATPNGVPLVSRTGKSSGGYRLMQQSSIGNNSLQNRLNQGVIRMTANAARGKPSDANAPGGEEWMGDGGDYVVPEMPQMWDDEPTAPVHAPLRESSSANLLDILDVGNKLNPGRLLPAWKKINGGDFMRLTGGGRFREENAQELIPNEYNQLDYPPAITEGGFYPGQHPYDPVAQQDRELTPIVSKGSVYPLESRNFSPGNIQHLEEVPGSKFTINQQWGSQTASLGKQLKRDELSLTRTYWHSGPALGVAYDETPQHILGQRATEPDMAHIARAFVLDRGGIIPEGQMWKDVNYSPWVFGDFEQNPEKHQIRFDPNYSDKEVLGAAGLLGADGEFSPRVLRAGEKVLGPNGYVKDLLQNNEAGVINDYEIVEDVDQRGRKTKALRFKGYFGNRPNVASAMKLEGHKHLAQDKHVRENLGIDADIIMNRPSDTVVAGISMLNAMPRPEFEDLWREVHGDQPPPKRTANKWDVEDLSKVWQKYQEKNRATEILRGQVMDEDTLKNYLAAGIVRDGKYTKMPPLFKGAEQQYKADLIATGYYAPVRVKMVTDVTNLKSGHLSNDTLEHVERNYPGLGENLRDAGYEGRDIYNTLFEMHRLNTEPGFSEYGSPVVDLVGDLMGNPAARADMETRYTERLDALTPEAMRGMSRANMTDEQQKLNQLLERDASAQAIRGYYDEELGTDSYIFRMGEGANARHIVNPGMVERFGYVDEESNERFSKLKNEGDFQLKQIWAQTVGAGRRGPNSQVGFLREIPTRMAPVIQGQEELLGSASARKKWFGTDHRSISTHVHASDYGLPRNSMARAWDDIFNQTGLKRTKANRAILTAKSRAGELPFGGVRNPVSSPVAQTGAILNMVTPDMIKEAGLDIPLTGHPDFFHPHHVQAAGGDNDSDMSQVYMALKLMAGELVNAFNLKPSDPQSITARAKRDASGEYEDALKKLNVLDPKKFVGMSPREREMAVQQQMGLNRAGMQAEGGLVGKDVLADVWMNTSKVNSETNKRQIGQSYNAGVRIGTNLTKNPEAQREVSDYAGWLYQPPLDKNNYDPGSPEDDLFKFFTSFNAFTGAFADSREHDPGNNTYYSYRKTAGFENRGQFGAAGLLAILKRLTEPREGTQARMTPKQMAAFMTRSAGDLGKSVDFQSQWNLPEWTDLNTRSINAGYKIGKSQQQLLERFATEDSPLAQMMRGYGVRKGVKGAVAVQRRLAEDFQTGPLGEGGPESKQQSRGELRDHVNVMQNEMYNWGNGSGSPEFKRDFKAFTERYAPPGNNFFTLLEPGSRNKDAGGFYGWEVDKRRGFYADVAGLLKKHVTGYGKNAQGAYVVQDPSVSRNNPLFREGYKDYDRIRDLMAINARDRSPDEVEGYDPTMAELRDSSVTGRLVTEKYRRKQRRMGALGKLFEEFKALGGSQEAGPEFEDYVARGYSPGEKQMWAEADRRPAHQFEEAYASVEMAEGGVLDRPTHLGNTGDGRRIIGGEAGREFVVPEGKTQDLGGGLKLFDTDELGRGAPPETTELAKGGIVDYEAYSNAPTSDYKTAIAQVAEELSGGNFKGTHDEAVNLVRRQLESDIGQIMANPPQGGQPGLMASSIPGRATDRMSQALGPNAAAADMGEWNNLLGEYGLNADQRPLGVSPMNMDPAVKAGLRQSAGNDPQAYKTALSSFMQAMNQRLAGKDFSHANYGNIYNAMPQWAGAWGGKRPASTIPAAAPSVGAQSNLARILAGVTGGGASGGGIPPAPGSPAAAAAGAPPPEQAPVIAFTKALTGQYVQQLETVQRGLRSGVGSDVAQAQSAGLYMHELPAEQQSFAGAAGAVQNSYQKELARAQRVLEKYGNQQESRDVRMALKRHDRGTARLDPDELDALSIRSDELKEHRAGLAKIGMTQRIPQTEALFAQQIKDILTSGEFGGIVKENPLSSEAVDAQTALRNRNYGPGDDYMKTAGSQYTVDPGLVDELQAGALIKDRTATAKPEIEARRQAEKNALKMGQLGRTEAERADWMAETKAGQGQAFTSVRDKQAYDMAQDVKTLSAERQALYEQARPIKADLHAAANAGDIKAQQGYFDQLQPFITHIDDLKDQIGALTPHVKENVEQLGYETAALKEQIKEQKGEHADLSRREETLRSQAVGMPKEEKAAQLRQADLVGQDRDTVWQGIKASAKELGQKTLESRQLTDMIHEPQGRAITGIGKRPETRTEQAMSELRKGYDTQKLFYQFQNMQQLQFMAFAPMLKMQQAYLGEQSAVGQANYALGGGGMPQSVMGAMASGANMSRAQSSFGRGVDNSIAMNAWRGFTGFLGQNEGSGSALGAMAFDATSLLTAAMGAKMVAGPMFSAIGKLTGGSMGPNGNWNTPGGMTGGTLMTAATGGGGLIAGGLGAGLGLGVNQFLAAQGAKGSIGPVPISAEPISKHATVAAYEATGWLSGFMKSTIPGSGAKSFSDLWDQGAAEKAGQAVGAYTGAVTDPIPVWITKLEEGVAKQLGVTTKELPFDRTELAQITQMFAETQGITKKQIEESAKTVEEMSQEIAESITSGVSFGQTAGIRQKAIDVSGYAPGTAGASMMSKWVNQGSLFEQQQRLQAAAMGQGLADQMDYTPTQRRDAAQRTVDLLHDNVSQSQVQRANAQRGMTNQYYWSEAAYASGQPQMAMQSQSEPWAPKYQGAEWAIEDRRRGEDRTRELGSQQVVMKSQGGGGGFGMVSSSWSGGRQETELGWQRQKLDLEQKFWDFRRTSQLADFAMSQKMFDFGIRQQRMAMEFEEKQSRSQSTNYEAQYAINKKIFELQSHWQRQDFDKQDARQDMQRSWQVEDEGVNRENFNIQSGWQQEDLQRALRYASSGRERMDIRRQMSRNSVMGERKEQEFDRTEARSATQYGWQKEDLATQRSRFEELNELQRQQMELGRAYWLEQQSMANEYRDARRAAMEEQIGLQTEQNLLTIQQFTDQMALDAEQHELETGINETKHQWGIDDLALARLRSIEDEKILGWQREAAIASQQYAYFLAMGYTKALESMPSLVGMADAAGDLATNMERYARAIAGMPEGVPLNAPNSAQAMFPSTSATPTAPVNPNYPANGPVAPQPFSSGNLSSNMISSPQADLHSAAVVAMLGAILGQLQDGGGTIILDQEKLKRAGFLHVENFGGVYR